MKQKITKQNESEEQKQICKAKTQLSQTTDDHQNKDLKVAAVKFIKDKLYTGRMCEKDFNSEKGLKGHIIFKHTSSTLPSV